MFRLLIPLIFLTVSQFCFSEEFNLKEVSLTLDDDAILIARAKNIHSSALTIDAHADIEIPGKPSSYVGSDGLSKVSPKKMRAGGLDAVVMSIAVGPMPRNSDGYAKARSLAQTKLAAVKALAADTNNNTVIVLSTKDLDTAHRDGKSSLLLGFQNALILGTDVNVIDTLYNSGVRVFALTHMGHNNFADSSRTLFDGKTGTREPDAEHEGLSDLGIAAVKKINALGGIMDISQLSKQAALQTIELSKTPVIASHSNVQKLTNVSRNLSDEEIDRIGETGGVIHVAPFRGYLFNSSDPDMDKNIREVRRDSGIDEDYLYPFELYWEIDDLVVKKDFLSRISTLLGPIGLDEMLDHVDYIAKRIGVEHVGIGTDFNHGSGIAGFDDASDALNVTLELLKRGFSEDDIIKIWGGNFTRVWRAAEKAAE
jgi:membrane dipeptidase|tara:strand:- start:670 stop:1947 length:1278 start_codon:yes stop_codon:yes gene_type:complete